MTNTFIFLCTILHYQKPFIGGNKKKLSPLESRWGTDEHVSDENDQAFWYCDRWRSVIDMADLRGRMYR